MPPTNQPTKRSRFGCFLAISVLLMFGALMLPTYFGLREAFFSPPVELSGEGFDSAHIAHVAAESGLVFPLGTVGLEYHYKHGQDPYGFAKLRIPAGAVERLLARAKIKFEPGYVPAAGPGLPWWRPHALEKPRELAGQGQNYTTVRCIVGEEAGQTIVYVAWFSI